MSRATAARLRANGAAGQPLRALPSSPQPSLLALPAWLTPSRELAFFRGCLLAAIVVDVSSSCLYLFLPAGTVVFFGGVPTPSAIFWCSTAATGDAVSALWCATALRRHTPSGYRDAARGLLLFTIVHLGAFARGHYAIEPHPGGGAAYVLWMLVGCLIGLWFGFYRTLVIPGPPLTGTAQAANA
jgi:hypothetical protein